MVDMYLLCYGRGIVRPHVYKNFLVRGSIHLAHFTTPSTTHAQLSSPIHIWILVLYGTSLMDIWWIGYVIRWSV